MLPYVVPFSQEQHWILHILQELLRATIYVKLGDPFMIIAFGSMYF